jgi:hypothetical protein
MQRLRKWTHCLRVARKPGAPTLHGDDGGRESATSKLLHESLELLTSMLNKASAFRSTFNCSSRLPRLR